MREKVKFKVLIEGVSVPVSAIARQQHEGMPARCIISLFPTRVGLKIYRGTSVIIFRWESEREILKAQDPKLPESVDGAWLLFFDGYVTQSPQVSKRESRAVILQCVQWIERLNSVYIRTLSIKNPDFSAMRDRVFMGTSPYGIGRYGVADPEVGAVQAVQQIIAAKGVGGAMRALVGASAKFDRLFSRIMVLNNLENRFVNAENTIMAKFMERNNLLNVITGQVPTMPAHTTVAQMMNTFMLQALYTSIMLPSPMYEPQSGRATSEFIGPLDVKGRLNQYIYKPQLFFAAPPKSNVVFPTHIMRMEALESGLRRPTRMAVVSENRLLGEELARTFSISLFYPEGLQQKIGAGVDLDRKAYEKLSFADLYTGDELLEDRLQPEVVRIPFAESMLVHGGLSSENSDTLARLYGRYMFHTARYASDPLSVSTKFDPYLICGLPCVILDDEFGYILGRARTVSDTINVVAGTMSTVIELANVRMVDDQQADLADDDLSMEGYNQLFGDEIADRVFFDQKFSNEQISQSFYEPFFGVRAVHNDQDGYQDAYPEKKAVAPLVAALAGLFRRYQSVRSSPEAEKWIAKIKQRPIVTIFAAQAAMHQH